MPALEHRLPTNGVLKKYTNFVNGYQNRYFEIKHGKISYYYSKLDKGCCRGSFCLRNALVEPHPDNTRDMLVRFPGDVVWYLQAEDGHERDLWVKALSRDYGDSSDYSSSSTKSHSRNPSVSSMSCSATTDLRLPVSKELNPPLDTRIGDLEGYRSLISSRLVDLEKALECGEHTGKIHALDVRATRLAVLGTIDDIVGLLRRGAQSASQAMPSPPLSTPSQNDSTLLSALASPGICISDPEPVVHPHFHNTVTFVTSDGEEEFHDADEHSSLGSIEEGTEAKESRASSAAPGERIEREVDETAEEGGLNDNGVLNAPVEEAVKRQLPFGNFDLIQLSKKHPLYHEIDEITTQQLRYAMEGVDGSTWTLFAEDGEMKMFKREIEMDGLPVDPLKALHHVPGVSALEYMHYFFDPRYKKDWDHTLEAMSVVEAAAPDMAIVHQKHKTVWPAASRESLFWSHIRRVDSMKSCDAADLYIVCNKDIVREDVPLGSSSAVRVKLTVSMVCETLIRGKKKPHECGRDDVSCRILYVSCVHPGGWVPTAALRQVYKREYPKFLRTFTEYVIKNVRGKPLAI